MELNTALATCVMYSQTQVLIQFLEPISGFAQSRLMDEPGESETQVRGEGGTLLAQCRHKAQPGQVPLPPPPVGLVTWVYRPANKPAEMM